MSLSIVIPVYNEVENLPLLHQALCDSLARMEQPWEVLLVDDGSTDGSVAELERLAAVDPEHVRVILFRRNFGQTAAMAAGIEEATGDVIVFMDADLQNDPNDIPMLLEKIDAGYDLVSGWRANRQDDIIRKFPSRIANRMIAKATGVFLHDYGCSLKAYRSEVIKSFRLFGEMHRFIPAYAGAVGAKILEVSVTHHARKFGKSKYGLGRTAKVIMDLYTVKLLTSFASKPMYLFGKPGLGMMLAGVVVFIGAWVERLWRHGVPGFWAMLVLGIVLGVLGFQCLLLGLLAELIMRTYYETQGKPAYHVRKMINIAVKV
ncbi:MAG TPA: glycosyltransferase family 2 protein [Armatimonadota bacterium]